MDLIEAEGIKKRWQEYTEFNSVTHWCPTLCNPMDCSTPGFPLHHQLPELAQTHIHRISDAIQPSHPLSSLSSPASIFPSIRVFSSESVLCITWPKYWSFSFSISLSNEYSGFISFRVDWFDFLAVQGTLKSFLQHHSLKASIFQHSAFFMVQLSHPYILVCVLVEKVNDRITRLFCVLCVNSSFLKNIGIKRILA